MSHLAHTEPEVSLRLQQVAITMREQLLNILFTLHKSFPQSSETFLILQVDIYVFHLPPAMWLQ